ncbi:MAG TPA: DMT family transporter [Luteolibacter sp.]|nr:DMT family transporter [Luteolibacter sp.]
MAAFFLVLACALWGLSFPVLKALHLEQGTRLPDADSVFLTAWIQCARFGMGALMLLPFLPRGKPTALELRQGLWLAVFGGTGMALQADGLAYTEASTSAFLTQAYCIVLPLVACVRTRRLPGVRVTVAVVLIVAGCAVLSGFGFGNARIGRGELETLAAAVFFSVQILTLENPRYRGNRSRPVTWVMCAGIAVMFLPVSILSAPSPDALIQAGASWPAFGFVLVLAAFCSVGAFLLMNHWQPRIGSVEAGMIYTSEPVFASTYALFLPAWISSIAGARYQNEIFTPALVTGGILILLANILMQFARSPHPPAIAPVP